jgi:hypothetical protein
MKMRIVTALALTAAAVTAAVGLSAPADASGPPGYVAYNHYTWPDWCSGVGYAGVTNHTWRSYYCETVIPTNFNGPGDYILWVLY